MAGDKGAEVPKEVTDFKAQRNIRRTSSSTEALRRAHEAVRARGGYQTSPEADKRMQEYFAGSNQQADKQPSQQNVINEAVNKFTAEGRRLRDLFANMTEEQRTKVWEKFGGVKPDESYHDADARFDEAVRKVTSAENPTETQTTQSEE